MDTLKQKIADRIREEGPMTFAGFMRMALYEPGLGYYTSGDAKIGRSGDFYTSPHLHPVFGALVGRQILQMLEIMGGSSEFEIVEVGGGRGYLCKDILDHLKGAGISDGFKYTIVELNPRMAERQKELLSEHADMVCWRSEFAGLDGIRGCILSNEVLDALPVHLVRMDGTLKEIYVTAECGVFGEAAGPPSTGAIKEYLEEFSVTLPTGYRTEVNLALRGWLKEVSNALVEGFVLTIDYGYSARDYYAEERNRGTLLCYREHSVGEDPFKDVGGQDITAHVNFSALKKWGEQVGLRCLGYCRQGPFLVSLGIGEMIAELHEKSPDYGTEVARIKGLIMPGTMGDTHKVMVQYRGEGDPFLRGFGMKNQVDSL